MKDKLEYLIQKAIDGEWLPYFAVFDSNMNKDNIIVRCNGDTSNVNFDYQMKGHIVGVGGYDLEPFSIIFDHKFVKALFGEEDKWYTTACTCGGKGVHITDDTHSLDCARVKSNRGFKYHLQNAVIDEDSITYLYNAVKALEGEKK